MMGARQNHPGRLVWRQTPARRGSPATAPLSGEVAARRRCEGAGDLVVGRRLGPSPAGNNMLEKTGGVVVAVFMNKTGCHFGSEMPSFLPGMAAGGRGRCFSAPGGLAAAALLPGDLKMPSASGWLRLPAAPQPLLLPGPAVPVITSVFPRLSSPAAAEERSLVRGLNLARPQPFPVGLTAR